MEVKLIPYIKSNNINDSISEFIKTQNGYIPYGINLINSPMMWRMGYTGKNVTIAVIDTGYSEHDDLKNNVIGGRNFTNEDNSDPNIYIDRNSHGTHVLGTIAGNGHVKGIAPDAKLLVLKALDKNGNGNLDWLIKAINYAVEKKVDIISMSLGCAVDVKEFKDAVKNAIDNDILVVCASGNNGDDNADTSEIDYPAYYRETISVGAVDNSRDSAIFTNSNKEVDIVAPGVGIISTSLNNGYCSMDGTSMATPHISGALALLIEWSTKEFGRRLSETELYAQLIKNTIDLGISKTIQGNGLLFFK